MPRRDRRIKLIEDPDLRRWYEAFDSRKTAKDRLRQLGLSLRAHGDDAEGVRQTLHESLYGHAPGLLRQVGRGRGNREEGRGVLAMALGEEAPAQGDIDPIGATPAQLNIATGTFAGGKCTIDSNVDAPTKTATVTPSNAPASPGSEFDMVGNTSKSRSAASPGNSRPKCRTRTRGL